MTVLSTLLHSSSPRGSRPSPEGQTGSPSRTYYRGSKVWSAWRIRWRLWSWRGVDWAVLDRQLECAAKREKQLAEGFERNKIEQRKSTYSFANPAVFKKLRNSTSGRRRKKRKKPIISVTHVPFSGKTSHSNTKVQANDEDKLLFKTSQSSNAESSLRSHSSVRNTFNKSSSKISNGWRRPKVQSIHPSVCNDSVNEMDSPDAKDRTPDESFSLVKKSSKVHMTKQQKT